MVPTWLPNSWKCSEPDGVLKKTLIGDSGKSKIYRPGVKVGTLRTQ